MTSPKIIGQDENNSRTQVLALQGSPRRGGNTEIILDQALAAARDAGAVCEKIVVRDLKISPCLEIHNCAQTGACAIRDDMLALSEKLASARVVILATPIFFYGPSAGLKAVIDRGQAFWARKYILKNENPNPKGLGVLIAVGATKGRKLFDGLKLTARYYFDALDLEPGPELLVRGADEKGAVQDRPEVLAEARTLGRRIAEFVL